MKILLILETSEVLEYLERRRILKQYQKAKKYILLGHMKQVNFKLQQPKEKGIYSFRINKQFRALCVYKKNQFRVFSIDNHSK